ncbi:MAG: efflux RND transporter periplasmic adaptor subunit [Lysobacteraceae bacterium]
MNIARPRSRRRWIVPAIIVLALIVAFIGWRSLKSEPPPQLATAPAQRGDIEATVVATGTLEAAQMVSVGAQVSGRVESLKVELGDVVKAGDLIAEIDPTTQQNQVNNARAAVASNRAQRTAQNANMRQAELAFERQKTMMAQEATSRAEYEAAQAALDSARAQIKVLDAQMTQAEAALSTAEANLGYTQIRAPMDGTVVAVVTKEGQTVNANQSAPTIVKLARLDTMLVKAEVSEADVVKVQPGQAVYFTILGNPRKRYYGTLRAIEPAPESISSETTQASSASSSSAIYYNALFEVPNPDGELRISMTTEVYIVLAQAKDAITIPSSAIERPRGAGRGGPGKPEGEQGSTANMGTVQVVGPDGTPVSREVELGIDNAAYTQIVSGLKEGEKVVLGAAPTGAAAAAGANRPVMRRMF